MIQIPDSKFPLELKKHPPVHTVDCRQGHTLKSTLLLLERKHPHVHTVDCRQDTPSRRFNKCPIYTYDGASANFNTNSQEMDNSVLAVKGIQKHSHFHHC